MLRNLHSVAAFIVFILIVSGARAQDDKVFRTVTPEAAEKLLQDLKIEFKKTSSKKGDEHYYDFQRENYRVRLTHFSPQEIMLDCVFRGMPIDKVNQWNMRTKVTRASWQKDSTGEFTILEYGLDISGGATAGTFKQFVARFDDELKKYDKFVSGNSVDDAVLAEVTNDKLESIFKTQGINYKKKTSPNGIVMFDFAFNDNNLRLYNFGNKDLMIDAHFKKVSLEDANRYNLNRKFIRVVNYKGKEVEYTALECNFDCTAGVTESMIRHWILSFGEDARHFGEYSKKLQTANQK